MQLKISRPVVEQRRRSRIAIEAPISRSGCVVIALPGIAIVESDACRPSRAPAGARTITRSSEWPNAVCEWLVREWRASPTNDGTRRVMPRQCSRT